MRRPLRVRLGVVARAMACALAALALAIGGMAQILARATGEPNPSNPPPRVVLMDPKTNQPKSEAPAVAPGVLTQGKSQGEASVIGVLIALTGLLAESKRNPEPVQKQVVPDANGKPPPGPPDPRGGLAQLAHTANNITGWMLPILIALAPLVVAGAALAMQAGARRRAVPVMYGAVGSVLLVLLAKGIAA